MRDWLDRFLGFALIILFVLGLFGLVLTGHAKAHSFYPWECCHDQDCWPTGRGGREPDPRLVGNGWQLSDGTVVPFEATRPSPDGRFHVCRVGGARDGKLITPPNRPPCLWVPEGGS